MTKINRKNIDWSKINKLPTGSQLLDKKYGEQGTGSREKFNEESYAYYTGQLIEEARKKANLTQEQLAEKIGSNKSYISRVETGKTEPKVSTFYRIITALGLTIDLKPIHS